ncbi:uncharacterized protein LOC117186579 [Drosophila miranda]|uniref:uncharacterized protein LOC108158297 n=1 Tax=Drosophila miranda TaxID=7229 RepID=UPI00143F0F7B|nr:uncharacterized protein LOC108158297 [Drosophila miranda]XP_033242979.1 uncharacterized protein LOC108158297 [Drosophila miranda]XP_033242981.1 uncharacterized protein LOC108158297 [Drosophila miranda]XP_033243432.1 uncharacterized protein LOC117186579 [Drosophila miranda]
MHRLLLVIGLLILVAAAEIFPVEPDLEGYQVILRRAANSADKLQVFQSIWGAIRSDFIDDTDKVKGLYTQLGNFIRTDMQCTSGPTGRSACELQQEVRRHLRSLMSQRLANLINAEESIQSYGMYVGSSIEPSLVRDILEHTIEDVYFHRPLEKLTQQLDKLYTDRDEVSFKMMIEAQLSLFWRYQTMHDSNEAFLFNMAHAVSKIQTHHMYASVDASLQRRVEALNHSLPPVLGALFHPQGFCLLSRDNREYLYTTITDDWNYGLNGRQVFTWHEQNYTDSAGLIRAFVQEQHSTPVFSLRSELFKWYFFVDPSEGNRLAALRSGSPSSSTSFWTITYVEDALIFRQRDLTLCAAEMLDKERRLIKMLPGQMHTPPSQACQWLPVDCAPPK